jgi:hypothetical protein
LTSKTVAVTLVESCPSELTCVAVKLSDKKLAVTVQPGKLGSATQVAVGAVPAEPVPTAVTPDVKPSPLQAGSNMNTDKSNNIFPKFRIVVAPVDRTLFLIALIFIYIPPSFA